MQIQENDVKRRNKNDNDRYALIDKKNSESVDQRMKQRQKRFEKLRTRAIIPQQEESQNIRQSNEEEGNISQPSIQNEQGEEEENFDFILQYPQPRSQPRSPPPTPPPIQPRLQPNEQGEDEEESFDFIRQYSQPRAPQPRAPQPQPKFSIYHVQQQSIQPRKRIIQKASPQSIQPKHNVYQKALLQSIQPKPNVYQKALPQSIQPKPRSYQKAQPQSIKPKPNVYQKAQHQSIQPKLNYYQQEQQQMDEQFQKIPNSQTLELIKTSIPNLYINKDRHKRDFYFIGYWIQGIDKKYPIHRFINIHKSVFPDIVNIFGSIKHQKNLPIYTKVPGSDIMIIKDNYKGLVMYGLRHYNYYDDEAQPTRLGFNLNSENMKTFINDLIVF